MYKYKNSCVGEKPGSETYGITFSELFKIRLDRPQLDTGKIIKSLFPMFQGGELGDLWEVAASPNYSVIIQ